MGNSLAKMYTHRNMNIDLFLYASGVFVSHNLYSANNKPRANRRKSLASQFAQVLLVQLDKPT